MSSEAETARFVTHGFATGFLDSARNDTPTLIESFDLVVVGSSLDGYVAAIGAAQLAPPTNRPARGRSARGLDTIPPHRKSKARGRFPSARLPAFAAFRPSSCPPGHHDPFQRTAEGGQRARVNFKAAVIVLLEDREDVLETIERQRQSGCSPQFALFVDRTGSYRCYHP